MPEPNHPEFLFAPIIMILSEWRGPVEVEVIDNCYSDANGNRALL
jgi:hypothetical protein